MGVVSTRSTSMVPFFIMSGLPSASVVGSLELQVRKHIIIIKRPEWRRLWFFILHVFAIYNTEKAEEITMEVQLMLSDLTFVIRQIKADDLHWCSFNIEIHRVQDVQCYAFNTGEQYKSIKR